MVPSTHYEVERLLAQVLIILACVGCALLVARLSHRLSATRVVAVALGLVSVALAATEVGPAIATLNTYHRSSESAVDDRDYCVIELHARALVSFITWLHQELPPHSVYVLVRRPPPDGWCLNQTLLPMLPAKPGEHFDWTITFGVTPPSFERLIEEHSPSVRVYRPGYAIARAAPSAKRS